MNVKNVLDKIKIALECDTYIDIANKLEVTPGAVDNWKKRNAIPNKYLLKVAEDTGVSIDWLIDKDKPTFAIYGGKGHVNNVNDGGIGIVKNNKDLKLFEEDEVKLFEENNPVFFSFQKAYEKVKNEKDKLNELEDLLENFYRKYR